MLDASSIDHIVQESVVQLWAAAQTDFDPFSVDPSQWHDAVPVRDVDIATDTRLDIEDVRAALGRLEGEKLVLGRDGGTIAVLRPVREKPTP